MTRADRVRFGLLVLAVVTAVAFLFARDSRLVDLQPGGSVVAAYLLPSFLAGFVATAVLAVRRPFAGAGLACAGVTAIVVMSIGRLEVASIIALAAVFGTQPVAWMGLRMRELANPHGDAMTRRRALAMIGGTLLGVAGGALVARYVRARLWGPTHPESQAVRLADSPVTWMWCGAMTPTSATIRVRPRGDVRIGDARLVVDTTTDMDVEAGAAIAVPLADVFDRVLDFRVVGLEPDTRYHYAVELDGTLDRVRVGAFRTFPDARRSIRVAFGACARIGSNGAVFDAIGESEPDVYVCLGDFHYGDNFVDDVDDYRQVFDVQLTQPAQSALYRQVPIAYVWDDHDYGPNDSNQDAPGRPAAMRAYREYVPHYDLASADSAIYQAFDVGTVRVILTDARSARTPQSRLDDADKSLLGLEQRTWLLDELTQSSSSHDLVIWVNPVPWIARPRRGGDSWSGYATERALIAEHIAANRIDNLVMVSGDAHMVAIDDGTNTNYTSRPGRAFPLLHAAALDRPGGIKGGPYTHGPLAGGGQFAIVDVEMGANGVDQVVLRAVDWRGTPLLELVV